jgi:hypothetical protein
LSGSDVSEVVRVFLHLQSEKRDRNYFQKFLNSFMEIKRHHFADACTQGSYHFDLLFPSVYIITDYNLASSRQEENEQH